jgi:hypothetical protein
MAVVYALLITVPGLPLADAGAALLGAVMHGARTTGMHPVRDRGSRRCSAGCWPILASTRPLPWRCCRADRPPEGWMVLLMIVLLLLLGTFMDLAPLILICTPIFLPVARAFEIAPVHFGIVLILAGGIGLITPPVGSVLFVGAAIAGIPMTHALKTIWPFWLSCVAVLMLVTFIPALSLWLPSLMK